MNDSQEQAYIDWMSGRVHWTPRGFRLSGRGNRRFAPSWSRSVYGKGGVRLFDSRTFHTAAQTYVTNVLGWQYTDSIWGRYLACQCGINVQHPAAYHRLSCVLSRKDEQA